MFSISVESAHVCLGLKNSQARGLGVSCLSTLEGMTGRRGDSKAANGVWWKDDALREAAVSLQAVQVALVLTASWRDAKGTSTSRRIRSGDNGNLR